jgi:hypothetical protein
VLLYNWKGAFAVACLVVLSLPQTLFEKRRAKLDAWISPERRRKFLVALAFLSLLVASFEAYDDVSARNRALSELHTPSQRNITEVRIDIYRAQPNDDVLNVVTLPVQIILPSYFPPGKTITVKDKKGAANATPIVVTAENGKIDGLPDVRINVNRGFMLFIWEWQRMVDVLAPRTQPTDGGQQ